MDCEIIITSNEISGNSATDGGGIFCQNSNLEMFRNNISENAAGSYGGGILCNYSRQLIGKNVISENSASWGGGIACTHSDLAIFGNIIIDNNTSGSEGGGGGIFCEYSSPTLSNNSITGNSVLNQYGRGGGIYCLNSSPIINNTIFWDNYATNGSQIFNYNYSYPVITFCDIQGGWEGEGNIDVDPLFRDPDNGDFHLMSTACDDPLDSPCIDAGHPDILDSLLSCDWGLGELRSDMGAYGGGDSVTVGIDNEVPETPDRFAVAQNYPNPFNISTIIHYQIPATSDVRIDIYDILGRKVAILVDEKQPAGYHQAIWNADGRSSGVYFYRIQAGDFIETKRMMLLK